jgi:nicotinamide-nucleotide amidase
MMRLELITTGTELLLGNTLNTHLTFLGEHLLPFGLRIGRQIAIPDGDVIRQSLLEAFPRNEIVIVTGGLGPTSDDITREITADLLGLSMAEDAEVLQRIKDRLARRKKEINDQTRRQAQVPIGAQVLHNDFGTAPGLYFPAQAHCPATGGPSPHLFLLPGPPRELRPMFTNVLAPLLRSICAGKTKLSEMRNFRLAGLGESEVSATVEPALVALGEDLEIGYCARMGEVIVRVLGTAEQMEASRNIVAAAFPQQFFSADDHSMEFTVVDLLKRFGRTLATAESCTGGLIAHQVTNVPGASAVLRQGYVTYANEAKTELLGIPETLLASHGAVSEQVCRAMAEGCLARAGTDYAVAVTGIAGPDGGTAEKPVGTVFIGVASKDGQATIVERHLFTYERTTFKSVVAQTALDLVRKRCVGFI